MGPLGAFYLVARDVDWDVRPENQTSGGPTAYSENAAGAIVSDYNLELSRFEAQQRTRSDLHAAIIASIGLPFNASSTPNTPSTPNLSLPYNLS
jgi:hypothetical protein